MKCLSIQQPWASLIVYGFKPVENRRWLTHYRGPVLIHAGQIIDKEADAWLWQHERELALSRGWNLLPFKTGGIIGRVELYDVTEHPKPPPIEAGRSRAGAFTNPSAWYFGRYGFWLRDAQELRFTPYRGHLGLFDVPDAEVPDAIK